MMNVLLLCEIMKCFIFVNVCVYICVWCTCAPSYVQMCARAYEARINVSSLLVAWLILLTKARSLDESRAH